MPVLGLYNKFNRRADCTLEQHGLVGTENTIRILKKQIQLKTRLF
jgi:hypothetical protein